MNSASKLRESFFSRLDADAINRFGDVPVAGVRSEIEAVLDAVMEKNFPHWSQQTKSDCRYEVVAELAGMNHEEFANLVRQFPTKSNFWKGYFVPGIVLCLVSPFVIAGILFDAIFKLFPWLPKSDVQRLVAESDDRELALTNGVWRSVQMLVANYWPKGTNACLCCLDD